MASFDVEGGSADDRKPDGPLEAKQAALLMAFAITSNAQREGDNLRVDIPSEDATLFPAQYLADKLAAYGIDEQAAAASGIIVDGPSARSTGGNAAILSFALDLKALEASAGVTFEQLQTLCGLVGDKEFHDAVKYTPVERLAQVLDKAAHGIADRSSWLNTAMGG